MQRREFNKALVGGALGAGLTAPVDRQPASAQARSSEGVTPRKNTLMHVGADYHYIVLFGEFRHSSHFTCESTNPYALPTGPSSARSRSCAGKAAGCKPLPGRQH